MATSKPRPSYKKLYLEEKRRNEQTEKIPYRCPICNSQLEISGLEIVCTRLECSYDKIWSNRINDIMDRFYPEAKYDEKLE